MRHPPLGGGAEPPTVPALRACGNCQDTCVDQPETRYAKTADGVHIAYQAVGDGTVDMVFVMGWVTNVEAMWMPPASPGSSNASRRSRG